MAKYYVASGVGERQDITDKCLVSYRITANRLDRLKITNIQQDRETRNIRVRS
jgi:hypothetical protein